MNEVLYVINLHPHKKWYVGKTKDYKRRMDQHLADSSGAAWCKKYASEDAITQHHGSHDDATWLETRKTLELMIEHGLNNVRGAEYCQLADFTVEDATRMSYAAVHHLKRSDRGYIENKFRKSCMESNNGSISSHCVSGNSSNYNTSISSCTSSLSPPVKLNNYNTISHSNTTNVVQSNIRSSGNSLEDELKSWRSRVAKETNRAPFMIFSEETLNEIVNTMPRTSRELLAIKGIGQVKVDDFGADVLSTTKTHCIYTKYTTTAVASSTKQKANQQCQRCRMDIPTDPDKPLCYGCYRTLTKGSK